MSGQSLGSAPIFCAHLLRRVDEKLVDLLGSLEPSEWDLRPLHHCGRSATSQRICSMLFFASFPWCGTLVMEKPLLSVHGKM